MQIFILRYYHVVVFLRYDPNEYARTFMQRRRSIKEVCVCALSKVDSQSDIGGGAEKCAPLAIIDQPLKRSPEESKSQS